MKPETFRPGETLVVHPAISPAAKRALLERLAARGEILDYFITTFKHRDYEIACILENGFDAVDYDNLKGWFADDEPSEAQNHIEEGRWLDRQRA